MTSSLQPKSLKGVGMPKIINGPAKLVAILALFGGVFGTQLIYDTKKIQAPETDFAVSPKFLAAIDIGLHSALASYLWLFKTRTELIHFLFLSKKDQEDGFNKFSRDINTINTLDPKYSDPYAYSVIVLPASTYSKRIEASIEIGKRGVANADPDWQIPFYMAVTYHLDLKDSLDALRYFDIASRTPGIPNVVKVFAANYGSIPTTREQTKQIWTVIYKTTDDEATRERAQSYIVHLDIFDFLENAVKEYKTKFGMYPKDLSDLVSKKIIPEIPLDPLGFTFYLFKNGEVRVKD